MILFNKKVIGILFAKTQSPMEIDSIKVLAKADPAGNLSENGCKPQSNF